MSQEDLNFENLHHNFQVNKASKNLSHGIFQSQCSNTDWREKHNAKPKIITVKKSKGWIAVGAKT